MNKFICILITASLYFTAASAQQKRYIYIDSSLLKNESSYDDIDVVPDGEKASSTGDDQKNNEPVTVKQGPDTTLYLNGLAISPDSVKRWKNAGEFAYMKYLDSLLKAKQEKEKNAAKHQPPSTRPGFFDALFSSAFLKILLWALAGFFILFIIYRLFLAEGAFRRDTKKTKGVDAKVEEENITAETDFDLLVNQALQQRNFRLAVRYQYLRSLHKLAEKNLVELAPDKTNYQYVRELKNPSLLNDFTSLTLNYEYVWYGEFEVAQDIYQKIENGFKAFNQKIQVGS